MLSSSERRRRGFGNFIFDHQFWKWRKVCRLMLKRVAALHVTKNIGCLSNGIRTELHILGPAILITDFLLICEVSQRLVDYSSPGVSVVRGGRSCCCLTCYCQSLWDGVYWLQRPWMATLCRLLAWKETRQGRGITCALQYLLLLIIWYCCVRTYLSNLAVG